MCAQTCPEAQLCRSCLPPSDAAPERPRVPLSSAQRVERFVADAAPERPRVPLGSAQRFERFVADAAPERPRVPLSSAQRFERFSDLLQLVFVRGTRRQLSPRERPF